ncbi:hypothetical protein HDU86_001806 [Geranomyces michiganensis]|nr:hypothetical protein HDU86_001806 [Geranomyces michiganensis]
MTHILHYEGERHYVLAELKAEVLQQHHNQLPKGAHDGMETTYAKLLQHYYWPNMRKGVRTATPGQLQVLMVIDYLSQRLFLVPTTTTVTSHELAQLYMSTFNQIRGTSSIDPRDYPDALPLSTPEEMEESPELKGPPGWKLNDRKLSLRQPDLQAIEAWQDAAQRIHLSVRQELRDAQDREECAYNRGRIAIKFKPNDQVNLFREGIVIDTDAQKPLKLTDK